MFDKAIFFDNLANLIKKDELTQKEFCEKLSDRTKPYYYGLRQDTLSKMKNTNAAVPIEFVCAVSQYFNISIDKLVGNDVDDSAESELTYADVARFFERLYREFGIAVERSESRHDSTYSLEYRTGSPWNCPVKYAMFGEFLDMISRAIEADRLTVNLQGLFVFDLWYDSFMQGADNYTLSGHDLKKNDNAIEEFDAIIYGTSGNKLRD